MFPTELQHDVSITMSSDVAVTGEMFTLKCIVQSHLPTVVSWIDNTREPVSGVRVSAKYVAENEGALELHFDSLHTSHGGLYTCISRMNISSARNISSQQFLLEVKSKTHTWF